MKRFGSYCPARITEQDIADAIAWVRSEPEDKNVDREGFRRVHLVLCEAIKDGQKIELRILENAEPERLHRRETELIRQLRPTLNGGAV